MRWYSVTYRSTAEMVIWVEADSADEARVKAEGGYYDESTDIEFVPGKPYTTKVRRAKDYVPSEALER